MRALLAALLVLSAVLNTALAQQASVTIGSLSLGSHEGAEPAFAAFREGLRQQGFVEGKNLRIEYRHSNNEAGLRARAEELVRAKVALIFARGTPEVYAAKAATSRIPIVFAVVSDPVVHGFADSFARPGHNITGVAVLTEDLTSKRLEVLHDAFPKATKIAVLYSESHRRACGMELRQLRAAARHLNVDLVETGFSAPDQISDVLDKMRASGVGAVVVPLTISNADHGAVIARHAAERSIPMIQDLSSSLAADSLLGYGPEPHATFGRAGVMAGRILKGASPAVMPIEQPHRYELVVNIKSARSQKLSFSDSFLLRATRIVY